MFCKFPSWRIASVRSTSIWQKKNAHSHTLSLFFETEKKRVFIERMTVCQINSPFAEYFTWRDKEEKVNKWLWSSTDSFSSSFFYRATQQKTRIYNDLNQIFVFFLLLIQQHKHHRLLLILLWLFQHRIYWDSHRELVERIRLVSLP